jgi:hypothetical protein
MSKHISNILRLALAVILLTAPENISETMLKIADHPWLMMATILLEAPWILVKDIQKG